MRPDWRYDCAVSRGPYFKEEDPVLWLMRELCDVLTPRVERTNGLLRVEERLRIELGGKRHCIRKRNGADRP